MCTHALAHNTGMTSANAHEAIDYGLFASWWNDVVSENEQKRNFQSGIFRKTAALLRQHGTDRKKILDIHNTISGMNQSGDQVIPRPKARHCRPTLTTSQHNDTTRL